MKNSTNEQKKKGLGALDVVLILALAACVVAGGFAIVFKRTASKNSEEEIQLEEYVLSFEIYKMRQSTAEMLNAGDIFYTSSGDDFGVLNDNITITPAVVYVVDSNGNYVKTYAPENGDYTSVDVSGSIKVKGTRDDKGFFMLNGENELVPNKSVAIKNETLAIGINITGIEKVSK